MRGDREAVDKGTGHRTMKDTWIHARSSKQECTVTLFRLRNKFLTPCRLHCTSQYIEGGVHGNGVRIPPWRWVVHLFTLPSYVQFTQLLIYMYRGTW